MVRRAAKTLAAIFLLLAPSFAAAQTNEDQRLSDDRLNREERQCRYHAPALSIEACTRLIDKTPDGAARAGYYARRGFSHSRLKECDLAIADYSEAIRLAPSNENYLARSTEWAACKGDLDRSIADLTEAIRLQPDAYNHILRGERFAMKGDLARAAADFDRAIRIDPKSARAFNGRGMVWRDRGDFKRALADLDTAIQLESDSSHYANRGSVWRAMGDLTRALADQDKAVEIGTDQTLPFSLARRGDTLRYMGNYPRALADYDKALELAPNFIVALTGRGLTYEKMGDTARARTDFAKAVESRWTGDVDGARETARARLASFDSGQAPPSIPAAPSKAAGLTSIPTPAIAAPILTKPLPADQVQAMAASQGRRIALVIGNTTYMNKSMPSLLNPRNDAEAMASLLRNIGFQSVTLLVNASRPRLIDALRTMAAQAKTADWAVVYYAGHGIEANGVNYMIPVDANVGPGRDMRLEGISLDEVMTSVDAARKIKLVILDACRDNPFAVTVSAAATQAQVASAGAPDGGVATRSAGRGLGEVKVSGASLVVYAAKHGQTALDGEGENSPFAIALVQRLATPGVEINKIFRLVRDDVMEATAGRQEPFTYGSLPGREDFFFVAAK